MSMLCLNCMAVGAGAGIKMYDGIWRNEDDELVFHPESLPLCSNCIIGMKVCKCNVLFPKEEGDECPFCEEITRKGL